MNDSQHPINQQALPVGYECQGYTIRKYLGEDDFSISYLADSRGVNVVLMEYFPHSIVMRGGNKTDVLLKDAGSQGEYAHGVASCRDDLADLVGFNHPNILDTQTFFEANNSIYRVSEGLVDHEWVSLEQCLQDKALSEDEVMSLCMPILDAVEAIHEIGHIHSDLTPSNIVIHRQSGEMKVLGFGDMKYLFSPSSQLLSRHVSPGYSPCENYFVNENQGVWTDVYALGAILYRVLTGKTPISSASRLSGLVDQQRDPLVLASSYFENTATYSQELLSAVDHALAVQKQDRPRSIAEWREQFGSVTQATEEIVSAPSLMIAGISEATQESSAEFQTSELDFSSLVQHAPQEEHSKYRAYAPIAIFGGLISALLVGIYIYLAPAEQEVAIDDAYMPEVYVEEEYVVENEIYSETDYQPILDVPLAEIEQEEYADFRPSLFGYIDSTRADYDVDSTDTLTQFSSVKYLFDSIKIDPSKITVVAAVPEVRSQSRQEVEEKKQSRSVRTVSRGTTVKHRPRKTREQYQREWLAKQQQMKKRAELKQIKALLKKQKEQRSVEQIENQLFAENDW